MDGKEQIRVKWFSMNSYGKCRFNIRTFQPENHLPIRIKFLSRDPTVIYMPHAVNNLAEKLNKYNTGCGKRMPLSLPTTQPILCPHLSSSRFDKSTDSLSQMKRKFALRYKSITFLLSCCHGAKVLQILRGVPMWWQCWLKKMSTVLHRGKWRRPQLKTNVF